MTPVSVPPALSTSRWKGMPAAWAAWAIRSRTGWDTTTDPSMSLRAGPLPRAMGLGGASGQSPAGVTSRAMARSGLDAIGCGPGAPGPHLLLDGEYPVQVVGAGLPKGFQHQGAAQPVIQGAPHGQASLDPQGGVEHRHLPDGDQGFRRRLVLGPDVDEQVLHLGLLGLFILAPEEHRAHNAALERHLPGNGIGRLQPAHRRHPGGSRPAPHP